MSRKEMNTDTIMISEKKAKRLNNGHTVQLSYKQLSNPSTDDIPFTPSESGSKRIHKALNAKKGIRLKKSDFEILEGGNIWGSVKRGFRKFGRDVGKTVAPIAKQVGNTMLDAGKTALMDATYAAAMGAGGYEYEGGNLFSNFNRKAKNTIRDIGRNKNIRNIKAKVIDKADRFINENARKAGDYLSQQTGLDIGDDVYQLGENAASRLNTQMGGSVRRVSPHEDTRHNKFMTPPLTNQQLAQLNMYHGGTFMAQTGRGIQRRRMHGRGMLAY
jgi:hypothetical protein